MAIDSLIDSYKQKERNKELKKTKRYHESVRSIVGTRKESVKAIKVEPLNVRLE